MRRKTSIACDTPGTLICDEAEIMEQQVVTGIAFSKDEAQLSIRRVQDKPGVAASIFGPLAEANINVDMIVQNVSPTGRPPISLHGAGRRLRPRPRHDREGEDPDRLRTARRRDRLAKISVIGIGMRSHAGVAANAFRALAERGINIRAITTSEIKFSLLIEAAFTELAVRTCIRSTGSTNRQARMAATVSYAQRFEDIYLMRCFGERPRALHRYRRGHRSSTTSRSRSNLRGWSGITVESPWKSRTR